MAYLDPGSLPASIDSGQGAQTTARLGQIGDQLTTIFKQRREQQQFDDAIGRVRGKSFSDWTPSDMSDVAKNAPNYLNSILRMHEIEKAGERMRDELEHRTAELNQRKIEHKSQTDNQKETQNLNKRRVDFEGTRIEMAQEEFDIDREKNEFKDRVEMNSAMAAHAKNIAMALAGLPEEQRPEALAEYMGQLNQSVGEDFGEEFVNGVAKFFGNWDINDDTPEDNPNGFTLDDKMLHVAIKISDETMRITAGFLGGKEYNAVEDTHRDKVISAAEALEGEGYHSEAMYLLKNGVLPEEGTNDSIRSLIDPQFLQPGAGGGGRPNFNQLLSQGGGTQDPAMPGIDGNNMPGDGKRVDWPEAVKQPDASRNQNPASQSSIDIAQASVNANQELSTESSAIVKTIVDKIQSQGRFMDPASVATAYVLYKNKNISDDFLRGMGKAGDKYALRWDGNNKVQVLRAKDAGEGERAGTMVEVELTDQDLAIIKGIIRAISAGKPDPGEFVPAAL